MNVINWELPALISLALISLVVTLMLFRFVQRAHYLDSRPPLFIGGVVFMPLFVAIAVVLGADWTDDEKTASLLALIVGFWGSAAWLTSSRVQGRWVPGLGFGPGLEFRPEVILPGGIALVKGTILTGIGIMMSVQDSFRLPQWNWWGFVLAFFGIILLIPVRGMAKMLYRRQRFLGAPAVWQIPVRWGLLILGLSVMLYGFLAAFMGRVPLIDFRPVTGQAWPAAGLLIVSGLSLLGREVSKRSLPEGVESWGTRLVSHVWLHLSVVAFMYGHVLLFMGRVMRPHPSDNPAGLAIGATLAVLGFLLILVGRPQALRNELRGTIRLMVGMLAAMDPPRRRKTMLGRMRTIASYPLPQRSWHIHRMFEEAGSLDDPESAAAIGKTRSEVMMSLTNKERMAMMEAMDQLVA